MLEDIAEVEALEDYKLRVKFEDGVEGVIDVKEKTQFTGVFAPLKDMDYFRKVKVNLEVGSFEWPNGADIDPSVVYSDITGIPIEIEGMEWFIRLISEFGCKTLAHSIYSVVVGDKDHFVY